MQSTKTSLTFNIRHVIQEDLYTGFGAKYGYFQIKPVKSTENTSYCLNFGSMHGTKMKLTRRVGLKVKSCFETTLAKWSERDLNPAS